MVSPVNDLHEAISDPQIVSRGIIKKITHELGGEVELIANPLNFSETPIQEYRSPPLLNQHAKEILQDLIGLSQDTISAMRKAGAIG
ncbi:MAG: CoA transferase [Hyphomonas sp.]|nr:CoA transferase [Hyphomonas sp.]